MQKTGINEIELIYFVYDYNEQTLFMFGRIFAVHIQLQAINTLSFSIGPRHYLRP